MLPETIAALRCPICGDAFALDSGALRCSHGHTFDIARSGYVNLLPGDAHTGTADTADMVRARAGFLESGAFEPIRDAVVSASADALGSGTLGGIALDVGGGTGYYLAAVLDALQRATGVSLDISKHAAAVAARAHARLDAIVADAWAPLPLRDGSVGLLTCIFAPRNAEELTRVLAPEGLLLLVTPNPAHLGELRTPLGLLDVDPDKDARVAATFGERFELDREPKVFEYRTPLTREQAVLAAEMGPAGAHATHEELADRGRTLTECTDVTVSVTLRTYSPRRRNAAIS